MDYSDYPRYAVTADSVVIGDDGPLSVFRYGCVRGSGGDDAAPSRDDVLSYLRSHPLQAAALLATTGHLYYSGSVPSPKSPLVLGVRLEIEDVRSVDADGSEVVVSRGVLVGENAWGSLLESARDAYRAELSLSGMMEEEPPAGAIVCDTPVSNRRFGILAAELSVVALAVLTLLSFALILRPRLLAALCGLTAAVAQQVIAFVSKNMSVRRNRENDPTWLAAHAKDKKAKRLSRASGCHWYLPVLIAGLVAGIGAIGAWMNAYNFNQFLGSLISEHAWLPPTVMVCGLISFLSAGYKRQDNADDTLCVLRFAAMALTLAAMFFSVEDTIYYLCSFLMLGLSALSLARLNRAHNEFVSRPVPFFGKEGSEA